MLIPIKIYAERNGIDASTVRHKCLKGNYKTAQKIGRDWLIDEDEPHIDLRRRNGSADEKD